MINLINAQSIKGEMSDETIVTLNRFWDSAQDVAMACLTLPSASATVRRTRLTHWGCSTTVAFR